MGWSVVVVDIQLSISHGEPILHRWAGASWSWIYNYVHIENLYYSMGSSVVVVDIQLSIHIENLYYIVNGVERRGRGYTTIYTHKTCIT